MFPQYSVTVYVENSPKGGGERTKLRFQEIKGTSLEGKV